MTARCALLTCVAVLLGLAGAPSVAHGKRCDKLLPVEQRSFAHDAHAKRLQDKAGKTLACDGVCHSLARDQRGWRWKRMESHQRCSSGGCHKRPRQVRKCKSLRGTERQVCYTCHVQRKQRPARDFEAPREFAARYSHAKHIGAVEADQCQGCHGGGDSTLPRVRKRKRAGHDACAECHKSERQPAMTACQSCHQPRGQATLSTARAAGAYRVTGAFDHVDHQRATRKMKGARACRDCHSNLAAAASERELPLPTMRGCYESCHDGKRAFSALGATCSQCHKGGGLAAEKLPTVATAGEPRKRYLHAEHQQRGVTLEPCAACHALDASFRPMPPTKQQPHAMCASCHADEFFKRSPSTCGTCHEKVDPWTAQTAALTARDGTSEFGWNRQSGFSHAAHLKAYESKQVAGASACDSCHSGTYQPGPRVRVDGHDACAGCHGADNKQLMSACNGCHQLNPAARPAPPEWSVAERFAHVTHARDPRSQGGQQATGCTTCHLNVDKATSLASMGRPTMRSCDTCHNGTLAFKTTGFGCLRCHNGKKQ